MSESRTTAAPVDVSVVAPVFSNESTLTALYERVAHALRASGHSWELILVDDRSPDGSGAAIDRLAASDDRVVALHHPERRGQQRALVTGIRASRGAMVVTMDADLQDPPEAIPQLLERIGSASVVFAGRRGAYQSAARHRSSRLFKRALSVVAGTPADGGAFLAMDRKAADAIGRFETRRPFLPAMVSLLGGKMASVPVERAPRPEGESAYSALMRMRTGVSAVTAALWWRITGRGRAASFGAHNQSQIDYYGRVDHPNMHPHEATRYVENHIARVLSATGVGRDAAILEIGAGMGRYTLPMAGRLEGLEVLELSPCLLSELAERAPESLLDRMHCADAAEPPPVLLGRFDAVIGYFMLHHVHDLASVFEGVSACLKPGGRVVFVEPNPLNPLYYVQMAITPGMSFAGDKGILKMRPHLLDAALRQAGLRRFRFERFGFWPPFIRNTAFGESSERVLERVGLWRALLPFQLFVAEKAAER